MKRKRSYVELHQLPQNNSAAAAAAGSNDVFAMNDLAILDESDAGSLDALREEDVRLTLASLDTPPRPSLLGKILAGQPDAGPGVHGALLSTFSQRMAEYSFTAAGNSAEFASATAPVGFARMPREPSASGAVALGAHLNGGSAPALEQVHNLQPRHPGVLIPVLTLGMASGFRLPPSSSSSSLPSRRLCDAEFASSERTPPSATAAGGDAGYGAPWQQQQEQEEERVPQRMRLLAKVLLETPPVMASRGFIPVDPATIVQHGTSTSSGFAVNLASNPTAPAYLSAKTVGMLAKGESLQGSSSTVAGASARARTKVSGASAGAAPWNKPLLSLGSTRSSEPEGPSDASLAYTSASSPLGSKSAYLGSDPHSVPSGFQPSRATTPLSSPHGDAVEWMQSSTLSSSAEANRIVRLLGRTSSPADSSSSSSSSSSPPSSYPSSTSTTMSSSPVPFNNEVQIQKEKSASQQSASVVTSGVYNKWVLELGTKERNIFSKKMKFTPEEKQEMVKASRTYKQAIAHKRYRGKLMKERADEKMAAIELQSIEPSSEATGGGKTTKKNACLTCGQPVTNMSRHLNSHFKDGSPQCAGSVDARMRREVECRLGEKKFKLLD